MMNLLEAATAIGGRATANVPFSSVCTDSRKLSRGALFVALRGENFDGHEFVSGCTTEGAVAAMVDATWAANNQGCPVPLLVVADTRLALGALAGFWRSRFSLPVIGVTGSNGKTTVKEMCASILRAQARYDGLSDAAVLSTQGNFNNDIGLPLTLFSLSQAHRYAVIEMGMNRPGEIAYLARLARPTVAVVTNAQRAHLQGVGSVADVAVEKGAIYDGIEPGGVAIVNADDPHASYWRDINADRTVIDFGVDSMARVSGRYDIHGMEALLTLSMNGVERDFSLNVPGVHNIRNALAAAAACSAAGATLDAIAEGLQAYAGTRGRLQRMPGVQACTLVDDTYNANPDSVRAAIDVLAATPGRRILVLGDMGEIGGSSAQLHDEIGGYAKSMGVDALFALGDMSAVAARNFGEGGHHYRTLDALLKTLLPLLDADTVVLVKGSRFMRMERVVEALAEGRGAVANKGGVNAA